MFENQALTQELVPAAKATSMVASPMVAAIVKATSIIATVPESEDRIATISTVEPAISAAIEAGCEGSVVKKWITEAYASVDRVGRIVAI